MSVTLERPAFYDAKRVNEWCGLSSDAKPTIAGYKLFQGDVFIEIDTGNKYVYDATNSSWQLQPSGGGGGGTDINAVHYTTDSGKTDAQKLQARTNIGAGTSNFSGDYDDLTNKPDIPDVINNVTSTSTDDALSANMGKELQDQVNNLKNIGRFLAIWNSATGMPLTNPTTMPYSYRTGDYYRVGAVSSATPAVNYRPNGTTYDGTASTTVETESVEIGWVYYYDGTQWLAQSAGGGGTVQDVQINGTSILASGTGVANIPVATSNLGVIKQSATYKFYVDESGQPYAYSTGSIGTYNGFANSAFIAKQTLETVVDNEAVRPDKAQTLTDAQKSQARANINAQSQLIVSADWDNLTLA